MTARVMVSQNPPARPCSMFRPRPNTRPALILSPRMDKIAGSNVIDSANEINTTMIAPPASPRKIVVGTNNMPARASTTVSPLKKTARLAVAPDIPIDSSLSRPRARSSRYLDTMKSE